MPPAAPGTPPHGPTPPPGYPTRDPHAIGLAVARLGGGSRRAAKVALAVLASSLGEGDVVEAIVQGRFRNEAGVAALVGTKVVLVNDARWKPDVVVLPVGPSLQVQGWQDDRKASLTFVLPGGHERIEEIFDRPLAIEMAQRIRDRVAIVAAQAQAQTPPPGSTA
ncbi:MAG TPA: hypothetical protein VIL48_07465 [Acidimicrobiales bacterium]